jgi:hypothetical protein
MSYGKVIRFVCIFTAVSYGLDVVVYPFLQPRPMVYASFWCAFLQPCPMELCFVSYVFLELCPMGLCFILYAFV